MDYRTSEAPPPPCGLGTLVSLGDLSTHPFSKRLSYSGHIIFIPLGCSSHKSCDINTMFL
jgi:hypothetical protein